MNTKRNDHLFHKDAILKKYNKIEIFKNIQKWEMHNALIFKKWKFIARWKIALDYYNNIHIYADYGWSSIPKDDLEYDEIWFYELNNME